MKMNKRDRQTLFLEHGVAHSMPIAPKELQFSGNLFSARIRESRLARFDQMKMNKSSFTASIAALGGTPEPIGRPCFLSTA